MLNTYIVYFLTFTQTVPSDGNNYKSYVKARIIINKYLSSRIISSQTI